MDLVKEGFGSWAAAETLVCILMKKQTSSLKLATLWLALSAVERVQQIRLEWWSGRPSFCVGARKINWNWRDKQRRGGGRKWSWISLNKQQFVYTELKGEGKNAQKMSQPTAVNSGRRPSRVQTLQQKKKRKKIPRVLGNRRLIRDE